MAGSPQKVYRAWPSDPPTYHQAKSDSEDISRNRKWNYSLFDCCSPGTLCLTSCCLPCLTYGKTQSRRNDPSLRSFSCLNGPCVIWSFLSLGAVQWIMQTVSRGEMREQYGIEGSCCGDCCISTFFGCCALIQEEKEAELRTRPELVGYQRPHVMAIP